MIFISSLTRSLFDTAILPTSIQDDVGTGVLFTYVGTTSFRGGTLGRTCSNDGAMSTLRQYRLGLRDPHEEALDGAGSLRVRRTWRPLWQVQRPGRWRDAAYVEWLQTSDR